MQVVCGNCQLSFQAPEGAAGLMCPICRSPLRPAQAAGEAAANPNLVEWSGGSLDDLVAYLSGPATAVRIEVLPATGDTAVGEVHLLAGGISETLYAGKSTDDALDKLRGVANPRFRLEPRLPNPVDGDLGSPGPDSGTLDSRPLAHLMRYCEQYVITCGIEVWRGSETARVEYRKGEISGVTVGGIDAPERLAEVMQWASGNYRLIIPKLTLPESVPKVAVAKPAPAPAPAAAAAPPARPPATPPAARPPATPPTARPAAPMPAPQPAPTTARAPAPAAAAASTHATRTIFGMPALDVAGLKAGEAAAALARQTAAPVGQAPAASPMTPPSSSPAPLPAATVASGTAQSASSSSATKTIFGVPAPKIPEKDKPAEKVVDTKPSEKVIVEKMHEEPPKAARPAPAQESPPQRAERKTGARKTIVPAPAIIPPAASAGSSSEGTAPLAAAADSSEISRTTHQGYGGQAASTEVVPARVAAIEDRTSPVRAVTAKKSRGIPVWTYVGVGFLFGLALLGIYQLVGVLAH